MLSLASTIFARGLPLAGSLVVHASVVFVLGGGYATPARMPSPSSAIDVEVSIVEPALEVQRNVAAEAPKPTRHAHSHPHKHAYPVPADHDAHLHDPSAVHAPAPLPTTPVFAVSVPDAPRRETFTLDVRAQIAGAQSAPPAVASTRAGILDGSDVPGEAAVDRPATLVQGHAPAYPREAAEASLEADVPLEIVVDDHGRVVSARLLSSASHGLGQAAIDGVRAYRFRPAMLGGRATPVRMKWVMQFRLQ